MASIFKQQYTINKNGSIIKKKSQFWYIDYKAAGGVRKRIKGFKDKVATSQLAAKLEREAEQADAGIVDKYKEYRTVSLLKHLEEFGQNLLDKGDTKDHARLTHNRAKAIIEGCKFVLLSDVQPSKVMGYIADRKRSGLSIKSCNYYLGAIKQFFNWMVNDQRTGENPLVHLKSQNANLDIRRERRALEIEELNILLNHTLEGIKHHNLTGKQRYMLYILAMNTGFRAGELASLTWESFNLSETEPSVTVLAGYSKNKQSATLPLNTNITDIYRQWFSEGNFRQSDKVFSGFNKSKGAAMLRKDLEAAGISYQDDSGRYFDFHSLRHTFITNLQKSGVSPKIAQVLARHSTITLTMDTYTHIGLYDERAAIDSLPELANLRSSDRSKNQAVAMKTGTDDLPVKPDEIPYKPAYKKLTKNAYFDSNPLSANVTSTLNENKEISGCKDIHKPLQKNKLSKDCQAMSLNGMGVKKEWAGAELNRRHTDFQSELAVCKYL